jgi:hypothetical protein
MSWFDASSFIIVYAAVIAICLVIVVGTDTRRRP